MSFMKKKKKTIHIPTEQNCQKQKTMQGQLFLYFLIFYLILLDLIVRLGN